MKFKSNPTHQYRMRVYMRFSDQLDVTQPGKVCNWTPYQIKEKVGRIKTVMHLPSFSSPTISSQDNVTTKKDAI